MHKGRRDVIGYRASDRRRLLVLLVLQLVILAGCGSGEPTGASGSVSAPPNGAPLVAAATDVVDFLRGNVAFSDIEMADQVFLQLANEGGGTRVEMERASLSEPSRWRVTSELTGIDYSFAPPQDGGDLTVGEGTHFNCVESELSSRADGVDRYPHVGAMLVPEGVSTCLASWNVTFLFDPGEPDPVLVGAIYDQWEW